MKIVENDGHKINYTVNGDRDSPTLVMLHGLTDSLKCWEDEGYVEGLMEDYFLILIDARGHGRSGPYREKKPEKGFALMANDVVKVLDTEEVTGRVHLLGYSMGGTVAWAMARYHPERLRSLIVVEEPPHVWSTPEPDRNQLKVCGNLKNACDKGNHEPIIEMWKPLLTNYHPFPKALKRRLKANTDYKGLLLLAERPWPDYRSVAEQINIPCLVYAGDEDYEFYNILIGFIQMRNPRKTFVAGRGLNHITSLLKDEDLLRAIRLFLADVEDKRDK